MTRILSELLGAREPGFRLQLQQLEQASGQQGIDIRLTTEILRKSSTKIRELGLDPQDTTGPELYRALQERLLADNARFRETMNIAADASSQAVLSATQQFIGKLDIPRQCFAMKTTAAKRILKTVPPKKTMKALGYRSLGSLLKHEPVAPLFIAASLYEPAAWHKQLANEYRKLSSADFESRPISLVLPASRRWEVVAESFSARHRHMCQVLPEHGAIVTLPVTASVPALAITTVLLLLDGVNDIRCASSYLKLQQVRPDFGQLVARAAQGGSFAVAEIAGSALSWRVVQDYYHVLKDASYRPALFEPHVQVEDMELVEAERTLAAQVPAMEFWVGTDELALVEQGQPISFNMVDVALSVANNLPFADRIVHYVRQRVTSNLLAGYLHQHDLDHVLERLEAAVGDRLQLGTAV